MSNKYFDDLVKAVGNSFYYYTHMDEINLTNMSAIDFDELNNRWVKEYTGDLSWDNHATRPRILFNTFKPAVDQLVISVINATQDEIERRVNERLHEYFTKNDIENKQ